MAYIGHNPTNAGSFALIDDIASTFNGSNTTFTLQVGNVNITPNAQNTIIALDGVIQHTPESYTISGSTIAFTGAPASGTDFYGILMGNSSYVENNSIGADELSVSGDGTSLQVLVSDGDGTFSWLSQSALTPSANLVTGNTLKSTVTASSLTSVGTLTSLTTSGIVSTSKIFEASGQNVSHGASRIKISQENSALSEFRFYGADTSTPGSLRFIGSSSDGSVGNTRLTIASDGKVGIGEVNPSAILETTGAIDDNWAGRFENTHSGGYGLMAKIASSASGDYALQIRSGSTHLFKVMGNGDATFGGAVVVNGAGIDIANGGYISSQDSGSGSIKLFGGGTNKGGYIDLRGGGNSGDMRVYTGTSGDGTLALTIDSSQNATFAGTVTSQNPKWHADGAPKPSNTSTVIYSNIVINTGGGYNSTTGYFTAPMTGYYYMAYWYNATGRCDNHIQYRQSSSHNWDNVAYAQNNTSWDASGWFTGGRSALVYMVANGQARIYAGSIDVGGTTGWDASIWNGFSGFLVP